MNVALVAAGADFRNQLQTLLESQNHAVTPIDDITRAFGKINSGRFHLVVISDVPVVEDIVGLVKELRSHVPTRQIAILNVNASSAPSEVVALLDSGADDFLAKPFNGEIFLARVRTLLRRQIWSGAIEEEKVTILDAEDLNVHLVERVVRSDGKELALTRLEFDLLVHLMTRKGDVLKRGDILKAVWKYPDSVETRTLDKHVEKLRRKLGSPGKLIKTIHGVGYRFLDAKSAAASAE
jgi:DNA-binding response OmpR family regulator